MAIWMEQIESSTSIYKGEIIENIDHKVQINVEF